MDETVFFNLGNAIASSRDEKELMRTVQVEQDRRKLRGDFIIVEDPENGEQLLFSLADVTKENESSKAFKVKKRLE